MEFIHTRREAQRLRISQLTGEQQQAMIKVGGS
jgi:hypothetical protein